MSLHIIKYVMHNANQNDEMSICGHLNVLTSLRIDGSRLCQTNFLVLLHFLNGILLYFMEWQKGNFNIAVDLRWENLSMRLDFGSDYK